MIFRLTAVPLNCRILALGPIHVRFFYGWSADRLEFPEQNECSVWRTKGARIIRVLPAQAGIQRLKSLDHGQQHAGMTIKWDSSGSDCNFLPKQIAV